MSVNEILTVKLVYFKFWPVLNIVHDNHETDTMTNDDVLGDEIPNDQQVAFRQFCFQTLKLGVGDVFSFNSLAASFLVCCKRGIGGDVFCK
ncbi:hypothetical protein SESBI_38143 [Sesbania bispinosa]|nr:hypothetical protein SESBI_38143 [Sesbania bispinosa]